MKTKFEADKIDWKILELLQRDARMTNTDIGKVVGLTQPAITTRIRLLEEAGVIEGYSARVNPRVLGQEITAIIRVRTPHEKLNPCLKTIERIPEVLEVHRITGEDCFIIKATFARMTKLDAALDLLAKFGPVSTSLVLASYTPKPLLAPADS